MLQDVVIKEISYYTKREPSDLSLDTSLDDLGIDSLGAITILYELEDRLDIEVPTDIFDSLKTIGDIIIQLEKLTAAKTQA